MAETSEKTASVSEASVKMKGAAEKKEHEQKPSPIAVKRELKVEEKADEKTRIAGALKKSAAEAAKDAGKPAGAAAPSAGGEKKPSEQKPVEKKEYKKPAEQKPEEKKREIVLERVYTVPLVDAYAKPAKKRAGRAVKILREFLSRHMHAQNVKIDPKVNEFIESRGATSPAKAVRVNASKDKSGLVWAGLAAMK
ncbi:MAG: 50S ribosomal protein L31e [Candidatus Micrarchaeota archaeon]|nr:50S ribosomal protein L31e [Candidatus Micrarchaeota archaeon]